MIHKLSRQYFKERCHTISDFRLKVLECIINHLLTYSSDYFELIDIREDTFLYDILSINKKIYIGKLYVLYEKSSKMYLYFFCTLTNGIVGSPEFTMSKEYDENKNLKNQVGIPIMSGKSVALKTENPDDQVPVYSDEYYGFTLSLKCPVDAFGDFYFLHIGRSFAVFLPHSFETMGKYGNEVSSYFATMVPVCKTLFPDGYPKNGNLAEREYFNKFISLLKNKKAFDWNDHSDISWAKQYDYYDYLTVIKEKYIDRKDKIEGE